VADLRAVVQESWSRAVLAASSVEEQAQQLVSRIAQAFQGGVLSPEGLQGLLAEVTGKLKEQRQQLQSQVEDAVRRGIERLRLPSRADLMALSARIEEMERKIDRAAQRETLDG